MGEAPGRAGVLRRVVRVAVVAAVYAVGAALVLGVARAAVRTLPLPPLFLTLLAALLVAGLVLAVAVAWRYERIGRGG